MNGFTRLSIRVVSWGALLLGLSGLVSCVSYRTYDQVREDLARANRANEDLVRRLHQAMVKNQGVTASVAPAGFQEPGPGFSSADLETLREEGVVLETGGLALGSDLLFPSGVADLKKTHLSILDSVAELLKTNYAGEKFIIEGHTDNVPLKSTRKLYGDNWNLGYQRARAVFKYFRDEHQIPESQMVVVTYGFMRPVETNDTAAGRAKNRRVVIRRGGVIQGTLAAQR